MIKRIVKIELKSDKIAEFQAIFQESKMKILGQEGCFHVELLRCQAPDNIFFTFSMWESEEALNAYRKSELFGSVWPKTKACFANPAEAWSTTLDDAPWE
jgi:quinol monooxygenase YgiN